MFDNCVESNFIPKVIVLCGNFTSSGLAQGNSSDIQRYHGTSAHNSNRHSWTHLESDNFDSLADLIASYPVITQMTHFLFVPGPLDISANAVLPRRPLLSSFTTKLKTKVLRAHFGSNPCRIKFFGQEIVVYREDLMARLLRNLVGVKPDVRNDDLKRFVSTKGQTAMTYSHMVIAARAVHP